MFIFRAEDSFAALTLPLNCFARADNGKMRAANESYALKMNIIVILKVITAKQNN